LAKPEFREIFRENWLYFERSEMRENGLFSEKHHTIFAAVEVFW